MERLFALSNKKLENTRMAIKRYLFHSIPRDKQLIGIKGARGTGKTTLLLQIMKALGEPEKCLYISLDHFYFAENTLVETAELFSKLGGKYLFVDEAHKYVNWSRDLKNIYDFNEDLQVFFSGSSALDILKGNADLSRRAVTYNLHELSFREYLSIHKGIHIPSISFEEVLTDHVKIASTINKQIKPILEFNNYLKYGSYPFVTEGEDVYHDKLQNIIRLIIENDLPSIYPIEFKTTAKLEKLLSMLSRAVPFKPNISDLSKNLDSTRNSLLKLIDFLTKARLITPVMQESSIGGSLSKPDKLYLNNTSIHYSLSHTPNIGTLRETFFLNQITQNHKVKIPKQGDFLIDGKYIFEIGGENKSYKQIANLPNSYVLADNIEYGFQHKIPLWLFGFLY